MSSGTFSLLFVMAFANWRLSRMLSDDTELGPGNILLKFRIWLGVEYDEYSNVRGTNIFSEAILCIKCVSIWVGLAQAVAYAVDPRIAFFVSLPFFLSAVAVVYGDRA